MVITTTDIKTNVIDKEALPKSLREMADIIGIEAVVKLVEAKGGTALYVRRLSSPHWVVESIIGEQKAKLLGENYGSETIYIPKCSGIKTETRNHNIRAMYDNGESADTIARKYMIGSRSISNILGSCVTTQKGMSREAPIRSTEAYTAVINLLREDDLPKSLRNLCPTIGIEAVKKLIIAKGGGKIWIPEIVDQESALASIIGMNKALILAESHKGSLDVPICSRGIANRRKLAIKSDVENGCDARSLALKYGVSQRSIYLIMSEDL